MKVPEFCVEKLLRAETIDSCIDSEPRRKYAPLFQFHVTQLVRVMLTFGRPRMEIEYWNMKVNLQYLSLFCAQIDLL